MRENRRGPWRRRGLMIGVLLAAALCFGTGARAEAIAIACGSVGIEYQLCKEGAEAWGAKAGHQVQVVQTPASATDRLALFQQLLAAGMNGYVAKPIKLRELLAAIAGSIGGRGSGGDPATASPGAAARAAEAATTALNQMLERFDRPPG